MVIVARELTEIEEAWLDALPAYLEMQSCQLGLCAKADCLEREAETARDQKRREEAGQKLKALRYEGKAKWVAAVRRVEHLHIAKEIGKRQ